MASDDKKTKPNQAQKNEASPKKQDEAASKNKDNSVADVAQD